MTAKAQRKIERGEKISKLNNEKIEALDLTPIKYKRKIKIVTYDKKARKPKKTKFLYDLNKLSPFGTKTTAIGDKTFSNQALHVGLDLTDPEALSELKKILDNFVFKLKKEEYVFARLVFKSINENGESELIYFSTENVPFENIEEIKELVYNNANLIARDTINEAYQSSSFLETVIFTTWKPRT